jgi:hypothetical protein
LAADKHSLPFKPGQHRAIDSVRGDGHF